MLRVAETAARSDTGRQRRANEDSYLAAPPVFVVADGMGGARAGEVASRIAVETYGAAVPLAAQNLEQRLADRARAANVRIHELSRRERDLQGMGTTLTAVAVQGEGVVLAHVGDSRAYCLRGSSLLALTDDHSLVGELMRQGRLTAEEASAHPQRSIITRALGPEPDVEVDTRTFRSRPGDVYLLCSDGLTSMVDESEIAALAARAPSLDRLASALIDAANDAGGSDNVTVVLFRLEQADAPADPGVEQPTIVGVPPVAAEIAAVSSIDSEPAPVVARRLPRMPAAAATPRRRRRPRVPVTLVAVLAVIGLAGAGAFIASQTVYFVGTDSGGLVTLYRGLPYDLPAGIRLYTRNYVSGVGAAQLARARRRALLNHRLRSRDDAVTLMRQLELGRLAG